MLGSNPTRGTVAVAQLVEQWIVVPPVAGSILVGHLWVGRIAAITPDCKSGASASLVRVQPYPLTLYL